MDSPTGPYGFGCDYFSVFALENEYNVHEEMFIAPGCLNTKLKLGIYISYLIIFLTLMVLGIVVVAVTWRSDGGWRLIRSIKLVIPVTTFVRSMTFVTVLLNHHSALKYFLYAAPISLTMVNTSLVVVQWFIIVIRLRMFARDESSAKGIVRSLITSLWIFNFCFSFGEIGIITAAGVYRNMGGSYVTHNLILGAGFCWQGVCTAIFGVIVYRAGMALSTLLDASEISSSAVKIVSTKVKGFSRFMAFICFNTTTGSIGTFLWLMFTLNTERGMSGFFFLLMFVFVVAEMSAPPMVWWLVLKGPAFGLRSTSDSDSETGKAKDAALRLGPAKSGNQDSITESI